MRREGTAVLNIFNDHDYNRSVITIVASIDSISKSLSVHTFVVKYLFHSFSWGKRRVSYFAAALLLLQGFSSCPLLSNPLRGKKKSFNKLCQGFKHKKKFRMNIFLAKITEKSLSRWALVPNTTSWQSRQSRRVFVLHSLLNTNKLDSFLKDTQNYKCIACCFRGGGSVCMWESLWADRHARSQGGSPLYGCRRPHTHLPPGGGGGSGGLR